MYRSEALSQFSKHTPRILRRQLILQLAEQYLGESAEAEENQMVCRPSMQRFYGALLFVDISGFTALSLRLNVEELKNHINDYFSKMLDIVDKYEGDVVKFAGDALFIIWEASSLAVAEGKIDEGTKICLEKAVECGREISEVCGNHKVVISPGKITRTMSSSPAVKSDAPSSPSASSTEFFSDNSPGRPHASGTKLTPLSVYGSGASGSDLNGSPKNDEECAYLNVHSGVSMGLMAGVDIGADNRWEYFLIGEPLSKVAEAESLAKSGDIIICPESHTLLHQEYLPRVAKILSHMVANIREKFHHEGESEMPCGCVALKGGYCRVSSNRSNSFVEKKRTTKVRASRRSTTDEVNPLLEGIRHDVDDVYASFESQFMKEFLKHIQPGDSSKEFQLSAAKVQESFTKWAHACLTDDVARHVHQVMRSEYSFCDISRFGAYQSAIDEQRSAFITAQQLNAHQSNPLLHHELSSCSSPIHEDHADATSLSLRPVRVTSANHSRPSSKSSDDHFSPIQSLAKSPEELQGTPLGSESHLNIEYLNVGEVNSGRQTPTSVQSMSSSPASVDKSVRNSSKRSSSTLLKATFSGSAVLPAKSQMSAEMRTVTVMFVKIAMNKVELFVDESKRVKIGGNYRFLSRTVNECVSDLLLLNRFQKCITALSEAFTSHGGQMRQFIVDDKGTVCIGTFGLRGSVSDDNAAAALDTAHSIVLKLQALGLESSIGVTVGKAYCGLVGSVVRHEYAVMGPSTNLSARLMCKAPVFGIICDNETRKRDRTHDFESLTDIVAKGYSSPVSTFKPIFTELVDALTLSAKHTHGMVHDGLLKSTHDTKSVSSYPEMDKLSASINMCQGRKVLYLMMGNQKMSFRLGGKSDCKMQLHGRTKEIGAIVSFAFSSLLTEEAEVPKLSDSPGGPPRPIFKHSLPTRCIAITGTNGIGKTCLVTALTEQLSVVVKKTPGCNIQIFKSRSDSYNLNLPFIAWKPIILDMVVRIYRNKKAQAHRRKSFTVGVASSSNEIFEAIDYVTEQLPEELRSLKALFALLSVSSADKYLGSLNMSHQEKVSKCVDLFKAVLHLYTTVMKNVVFILMEDLYLLDRSSLRLLLEVYNNNTGVVVLFTGRSNVTATTKSTEDAAEGVPLAAAPMQTVLSALAGQDRFMEIELENLGKEASQALVKAVLVSLDYSEVDYDPHFYDKVYQVTAGNPFYAYEVAKSLASHQDISLSSKVATIHCVRVEEVICYRFDQLKNSAQTFLKMAAVACVGGGTFTLNMLTHIDDGMLLMEHTSNSPMMECFSVVEEVSESEHFLAYANILHSILVNESFIRIVKKVKDVNSSTDAAEEEADISVEALLTMNYTFEFSVALELSTIYNLLLDDQKHALHEELGEYLQSQRESMSIKIHDETRGVATSQLKREAFHWEYACMWSHAMICYYKAYEMESDVIEKDDLLSSAYLMLDNMLEHNTDRVHGRIHGISLSNLQGFCEDAFMHEGHSRSVLHVEDSTVMTLETVYLVFEGDSDLLSTGLKVIVQVALRNIRRAQEWMLNQIILEDALQMMLLTKNPFLIDSKYSAVLHGVLKKNNQKEERADGSSVKNDREMHFCLKDFWLVCFQVFSVYLLNFDMSTAGVESEEAQKAAYVGTLFLELTRDRKETVHLIQALIVNTLLEAKSWNLSQCLVYVEELKTLFDFEKHSNFLIVGYGADLSSYMLSVVGQYVAVAKDKSSSDKINMHATKFMSGLTHHATSLMISIFKIMLALAYNGDYFEAFELFTCFNVALKTTRIHPKEAVHPAVLHLCSEWLLMAVKHKTLPQPGQTDHRKLEESIMQVERLLASNQTIRYRNCLQLLLADLHVQNLEPDEHLTRNVDDCMRHIQEILKIKTMVPGDMFAKACATRLAVVAMKKVSEMPHKEGRESPHIRKIKKCFSVNELSDLRLEAQAQKYMSFWQDLELLQEKLLG